VAFIPRSQWIRLLLKSLGPGIITGAADDDPSGIATYSEQVFYGPPLSHGL
jgi:Mn2+/Fe2+ NRAMP family transporter